MLLVNWEPRANVVLEEREHMFRMTQSNVEAAAVQSKALRRREASDDPLIRAPNMERSKIAVCLMMAHE